MVQSSLMVHFITLKIPDWTVLLSGNEALLYYLMLISQIWKQPVELAIPFTDIFFKINMACEVTHLLYIYLKIN